MTKVTWYFDFISPYAYLALPTLGRLPAGTELRYQPILLAGLLKHWGQKGPAEIAPKRVWTYRECVWLAQQSDLPFRLPAAHPFNPLPYLRLAIAAGCSAGVVQTIFEGLWTTGADPADPAVVARLADALDIPAELMADDGVKTTLRENTDAAIRAGVFGVPTFRVGDDLFWGSGSIDFVTAVIADPGVLTTADMRRAAVLPVGVSRT